MVSKHFTLLWFGRNVNGLHLLMKHLLLRLYIVLHLYGVNHFKKKKLRNRYDPIGFYKPNLRWKFHILLNHSCTNLFIRTADVHFHVSRKYALKIPRNPMRRCFNSKRKTQTLGLTFCHIYIDIPFFFRKRQIANNEYHYELQSS